MENQILQRMLQQTSQDQPEEQCLWGDRLDRPIKLCKDWVDSCYELSKKWWDVFQNWQESQINVFFPKSSV